MTMYSVSTLTGLTKNLFVHVNVTRLVQYLSNIDAVQIFITYVHAIFWCVRHIDFTYM